MAYPDFVTISKLASLQTIEEISQPADDILVTLGNGQTLPWKNLTGLRKRRKLAPAKDIP
ncbi:MAG: hypothetical protein HOK44_04795 [Rhodobacteraceae bacterium]|nr:hypothetical protein [Paracoccaceae bacterium]